MLFLLHNGLLAIANNKTCFGGRGGVGDAYHFWRQVNTNFSF